MKEYFTQTKEELRNEFSTAAKGLSKEEAARRLEQYGKNALQEQKKKPVLLVFLEQFKDLLVIILIIAAIISALSGELKSTIVIITVIILNAILGTVQHFKAEKSLESLKSLSSPTAKVMRDGQKIEIPSSDIVPGDLLMLEAGDLVVADGRIIKNFSLQVNESSLTGESENVNKTDEILQGGKVALGDQFNMVFSSSLVTYGRSEVIVTATGMNTEIGKIASLMNATKEKKTPLQASLDDFGKKLAILVLGVCALVFVLGLVRSMPLLDSLMFAVALAVAAIPEALSSIVTIVLAIGTQKMVKEHAIIKELKAVESLGCVSVICSDKTGTLTQNKMTVESLYADGALFLSEQFKPELMSNRYLMLAAVLANDASYVGDQPIGDPTEFALLALAHKLSMDESSLRKEYKRLKEIPFDSDRKLMSTLHIIDETPVLLTKGALDVLLSRTSSIIMGNETRSITEEDKEEILNANLRLSENGLRVLALCFKTMPTSEMDISVSDEHDFTFIGLISMIDPPREESVEAVANAKEAGIRTVMITGDHKITATAIAKKIGIFSDGDLSLTGLELDAMSQEELSAKVEQVSVYARVSPEHKIRIVQAWQDKGNIVSMTGDGVNDAPALKKADIGVAMGITGTEVSKDAASMILTDDNFATIIKSVTNGRNIFSNIKNSIRFLLSGNMAGILGVLYTSILGLPMPFLPVHLLFINLLTDSLPAIAIGMETSDENLLHQKPRDPKASLLDKEFLSRILLEGGLIGIFTMIAFHIGLRSDSAVATSMAFATLTLARLFHGFNCRNSKSILHIGLMSNPYTLLAFIGGFCLVSAVMFFPPLMSLFQVASLSAAEVVIIYLLSACPTIIIQLNKIWNERKRR